MPYLSGGVAQSTDVINGEPVFVEETILFRQTERSAAGVVAYPFNRAHRLEFQGGVSQISFDQVTYTEAYDLRNGGLIFRDTQTVSVAETLNLGTTSAALVFDTSVFGATSPVAASATASRWRRRSAASSTRACSPTTGATSCRCRSTRSPRA